MADLLHETLSQDLTFISMTARRMITSRDLSELPEIADTADAMAASLRTILLELKQPAEQPLREIVTRAATAPAKRGNARLLIDVDPELSAPLAQKVAIGRVVREAVANALRHGAARSITISAERSDSTLLLQISDDGNGFDPAAERRVDAFGIDAMRNSIESLGGAFRISSRPGTGTTLRIELP